MSTSTRSKPESESSPETGGAESVEPHEPVEVELEGSRQRLISWTVFGIIFGILLVWRLGTVAVWAGWVLIALGLFRGYQLALTFIHPAGTIVVSDDKVVLPRKLHRPGPIVVKPSEVTAVYFLRRSVPMYHAAPVLVVEVGPRALLYPRDWFATEADQRHVVHGLRHHMPKLPPDQT
jgi:hypothetical protein